MTDKPTSAEDVMVALRQVVLASERFRRACAAQLGVGTSEVVALGHLHHDGQLTPTELGYRLSLSSGTMTALVDRLEETGLAQRRPNPDDRRSQLIEITPQGAATMTDINRRFTGFGARPLADLDDARRRQLLDIFAVLTGGLSASADEMFDQLAQADDA